MRNYFLTILIILGACRPDKVKKPDDLIGKEKMVAILTGIHLLESRVNQLKVRPVDSSQVVYNHLEAQLFEQLHVDATQYERSLSFYMENPGLLEKVYEEVVDSLTLYQKVGDEPDGEIDD